MQLSTLEVIWLIGPILLTSLVMTFKGSRDN